jgi:hypothetical protein
MNWHTESSIVGVAQLLSMRYETVGYSDINHDMNLAKPMEFQFNLKPEKDLRIFMNGNPTVLESIFYRDLIS